MACHLHGFVSETVQLRPDDIDLERGASPLDKLFGRREREHAAALLVRGCQARGNQWGAVTLAQLRGVVAQDVAMGINPFACISRDPFFRPDFADLVAHGGAQWTSGSSATALEFTEWGLEVLIRFVATEKPFVAKRVWPPAATSSRVNGVEASVARRSTRRSGPLPSR